MRRRKVLKALGVAALAELSGRELIAAVEGARAQVAGEGARHSFRTLDPRQNETVDVVSERILPETDTPGASAARVNEFVDVMLSDWFTDAEREAFLAGLAGLDRDGVPFVDREEGEQVRILEELERESIRIQDERAADGVSTGPAAEPFFSVMKWLTLVGYYTSRVGMEQELHYEVFPGSYDGCAPIRGTEA